MYSVRKERRDSTEIKRFKDLLFGCGGNIEKLCQEVYEIVICARNREDVLCALTGSSEDENMMLYNEIVECSKKHLQNQGHDATFADERTDILQILLDYVCKKEEEEMDKLKYTAAVNKIIENEHGIELTFDEIGILCVMFEPSKVEQAMLKEVGGKKSKKGKNKLEKTLKAINKDINPTEFVKKALKHLETTRDLKTPNPCVMILHSIYSNMNLRDSDSD